MAGSSERWADVVDDDVRLGMVHPIGRAVERPCARPDCSAPGTASLTFAYTTREAWIGVLDDDPRTQSYDLCARHVERVRPPLGWQLRDERPEDDPLPDDPPDTVDDPAVTEEAPATDEADPTDGADPTEETEPDEPTEPAADVQDTTEEAPADG
jgi:hypothetical protein